METLFLVLGALVSLSILVLVHELGHFIVAKRCGVWVEEFGIGYPPRAFGKKIGETIYSINWLPLGGFVRLHGETTSDGVTEPKRAFLNKSKSVRLAVSLAGVTANFIFAAVVFAIVGAVVGSLPKGIKVLEVAEGSPAQVVGIVSDDRIVEIDGVNLTYTEYLQPLLEEKKNREIELTVLRTIEGINGYHFLKLTPRINPPEGQGALGIVFTANEIVEPTLIQAPFAYVRYGIDKTYFLSVRILKGLGGIFKEASRGDVPQGVGGPLTVTAVLAEFVRFGLLPLMEFTAVISVNLALVNLIPFPPLDGSRVLLVIVEALTGGKKLAPKIELYMQTAGMAILMGLVLLMTATEIPKLIRAGSLTQFVENILGV